jgi:uncharacterized membrane protein YcaP (DUF421 family)
MHKMWTDMFWLSLPVTEKILRSVIVYLFLIGGLRLAGKRELAQLNPFDLIVLLTLSNTVQNAIIGDDNTVLGGLISAATLLLINYFVVRFLFRHPRLERIAEGKAAHLIHKGKIQDDQLAKQMISQQELEAAARRQGIGHLRDVEEAVIEPGGIITFTAREPIPEVLRHRELIELIDKLTRDVAALRATPPSAPGA